MKKNALIWIALMFLLTTKAQIKSSHDGFYALDSVFYQLSGVDSFKYCVNCYSADSLKTYKGGLWLYSRENSPNTWENSLFSKGTTPMFNNADGWRIRPDVVKANTIWVRIFNDTGYIDQHHLVFLGKWRPKTAELISIFLDSSDFIGPGGFYGPGEGKLKEGYGPRQWNYRLNIEKDCSYQVFGGAKLQLEAEQTAGVQISAHASADLPNKAMQLNANRTANRDKLLMLGKSLTDSLGLHIKILRIRPGGPNQGSNILSNEIALDIIPPEMGGEPSTPVCIFINGSFWTYAFAEEGTGPNHIARTLGIPRSQLTSAKVPPLFSVAELKELGAKYNLGIAETLLGNSLYTLCRNNDVCKTYCIYNDTVQLIIDTTDPGYNPVAFDALCRNVYNGGDSELISNVSRDAFFKYALSVWFFHDFDAWGNDRITLYKQGQLPWALVGEHYDFEPDSALASDWYKYFVNDAALHVDGKARHTLPWQATNRMIAADPDYLCLLLEDELNTTYRLDRIIPIAQKKTASLRSCINECSRAWAPKGWLDSLRWEASVSEVIDFLKNRPTGIAGALPKNFMRGADTALTVNDMNEVKVIFDGVPGNDVAVKLNSLTLKSDFSGKYYPKPDLRIQLIYDSGKYEFVKWMEYPNAPASFRLSANKHIVLAPLLKLKNVPVIVNLFHILIIYLKWFFEGHCRFGEYLIFIIIISLMVVLFLRIFRT